MHFLHCCRKLSTYFAKKADYTAKYYRFAVKMPIFQPLTQQRKKAHAWHELLKRGYISFKAFDMCLVWTNTVIIIYSITYCVKYYT